jgi:hypothetical protein
MIDWLYQGELWFAFIGSTVLAVMAMAKRKPSLFSLGWLAVSELGLLVQLVVSIALVTGGARAKQDTVEFFAYLLVALMVPAAAAFWALIERSRWSTLVLSVGAFTVGVMLARMNQLWFIA